MSNVRHMPRDQADNDDFTRVPPQDIEAEQAVLGGMLLARDAIADATRILTPSELYRPAHETIFIAIVDVDAKGEPADVVTITAELTKRGQLQRIGGAAYLHQLLQAVPTSAHVEHYAEIVHEHAVRRRIVEAATRITQWGYDGSGDIDDLLTSSRKEIETATAVRGAAQPTHLAGALLDWDPFYATDFGSVELLPGKLLAPGQQITIVGDGKAGKSLLVQEWLWRMATGQAFLGDRPQPAIPLLYVDAENGHQDIQERFLSYGAGPGRMGLMSYASFPPIRPLDTAGGGADLLAMVHETEAQLVCLDTVSRFISGPENDSDTWLSLYRHTLLPLKRAGIASVRLDHMGKDHERGARGSSAKTQDVDHVWELRSQGGGTVVLKRTHTRTGIGPDSFVLVRQSQKDGDHYRPGCTRHVLMEYEHIEEAAEGSVEWLMGRIDDLGLPNDAGNPRTIAALAHAGIKIGKDKIAAAVRNRKNRDNLGSPETFPETFPEGVPGERSPGTPAESTKPQVKRSPGTSGERSPTPPSPPSPPLREGKGEGSPATDTPDTPLCTVCSTPLTGYRLDRGYDTHLACDPETGSHPNTPQDDANAPHDAA
ncbi:DnaB-like helicase N-terminal domain-containing protein [Streptomyces sp. NPDC050844]|uniref:DnaB-like helicase N-terminal domain-containing protein n=1 Tax=Streptomyces sp. NPDC050844 TaxID=3155790 RepID=UPI0033C5CFE2